MTPAFRVKLALVAIASLLATTFAWNAAQGQNWPQQPPNRGGANIFTCPNCGFMYRGTVPPAVCPACKARIGSGVGDPGDPGDQPVGQPRFGIPPPPKDGEAALRTSNSGFFNFSTKQVVIGAVVVGGIVMGVGALAGGAFLVIYSMRNKNHTTERRRRPRRRHDDDYDE